MKNPPTFYRAQFIAGLAAVLTIAVDHLTTGIRLMIGTIHVPLISTILVLLAGGIVCHAWIKLQQKRRRAAS